MILNQKIKSRPLTPALFQKERGLALLFIITAGLLAAIFIIFPEIDLFISGLFYKPDKGFYLGENVILLLLHDSVTYITIFLSSLWLCLIIATSFTKKPIWGLSRLRVIYLLLALIIGPGLVVNTVFKDHWGRARPRQIETFGGNAKFTPAFVISSQCDVNCSFVSGDPSVGFYLLALALAIPRRRKLFIFAGLGIGVAFSVMRIVQGAHFLSDVIFSGIFTFASVYLLYLGLLKLERNQYIENNSNTSV